jgi:hypothetical protein
MALSANAASQSLPRRSWTSLIKNAHMQGHDFVDRTSGMFASWYLFPPFPFARAGDKWDMEPSSSTWPTTCASNRKFPLQKSSKQFWLAACVWRHDPALRRIERI